MIIGLNNCVLFVVSFKCFIFKKIRINNVKNCFLHVLKKNLWNKNTGANHTAQKHCNNTQTPEHTLTKFAIILFLFLIQAHLAKP